MTTKSHGGVHMCAQAGNEARALLLERESQRMRAELAALREGRNVVVPLRLSPLERCCLLSMSALSCPEGDWLHGAQAY